MPVPPTLTDGFAVFGYDLTGSTGTLFLFGIVVGAVAMLGMSAMLVGARRTASHGQDARRELVRVRRETAFLDRDLAILNEHRSTDAETGSATNAERLVSPASVQPGQARGHSLSPWPRLRSPVKGVRRDEAR